MPSQIAPLLSQGSRPLEGEALARAGYRVLVLCAEEYQPPTSSFPGLTDVLYAPNDDSGRPFTPLQQTIAMLAASRAADYVRRGKHVLVTCHLGKNRSGLVTALTLHNLYGWSGTRCIAHIKERRPIALENADFVRFLSKIPAKRFAKTG